MSNYFSNLTNSQKVIMVNMSGRYIGLGLNDKEFGF